MHIGVSEKDTNIQSDKYMPLVKKNLSMCHIHHQSTEMVGKLQIILKNTPRDTNQASPMLPIKSTICAHTNTHPQSSKFKLYIFYWTMCMLV